MGQVAVQLRPASQRIDGWQLRYSDIWPINIKRPLNRGSTVLWTQRLVKVPAAVQFGLAGSSVRDLAISSPLSFTQKQAVPWHCVSSYDPSGVQSGWKRPSRYSCWHWVKSVPILIVERTITCCYKNVTLKQGLHKGCSLKMLFNIVCKRQQQIFKGWHRFFRASKVI